MSGADPGAVVNGLIDQRFLNLYGGRRGTKHTWSKNQKHLRSKSKNTAAVEENPGEAGTMDRFMDESVQHLGPKRARAVFTVGTRRPCDVTWGGGLEACVARETATPSTSMKTSVQCQSCCCLH